MKEKETETIENFKKSIKEILEKNNVIVSGNLEILLEEITNYSLKHFTNYFE